MHDKTWFPSNEMHESPNLTNEPLWDPKRQKLPHIMPLQETQVSMFELQIHCFLQTVSPKYFIV